MCIPISKASQKTKNCVDSQFILKSSSYKSLNTCCFITTMSCRNRVKTLAHQSNKKTKTWEMVFRAPKKVSTTTSKRRTSFKRYPSRSRRQSFRRLKRSKEESLPTEATIISLRSPSSRTVTHLGSKLSSIISPVLPPSSVLLPRFSQS